MSGFAKDPNRPRKKLMCFSGVFYFEEIQIERLNVPGMACSALISAILAGMVTKLLINITGLILLKFGTPTLGKNVTE
jgi:hypothetical protein